MAIWHRKFKEYKLQEKKLHKNNKASYCSQIVIEMRPKCAQLLYNKPLLTQENLQLMEYKTEGNPNTTFINFPNSTIFLFCLVQLK